MRPSARSENYKGAQGPGPGAAKPRTQCQRQLWFLVLVLTGGGTEAPLMFGTALSDGAISHSRRREGGAEAWFVADAAHSRSWV